MKQTVRVILWIGMLIGSASLASAAPLYWDGDATAGAPYGGNGTWDLSTTADWNPTNDFSGALGKWNQAGGQDIAVFSNTAGLVTIRAA